MSGFKDHPKFQAAMKEVADHPNCSPEDYNKVCSVADYSKRKGYITHAQARMVGHIHKEVVHNGEYKPHNWWK